MVHVINTFFSIGSSSILNMLNPLVEKCSEGA